MNSITLPTLSVFDLNATQCWTALPAFLWMRAFSYLSPCDLDSSVKKVCSLFRAIVSGEHFYSKLLWQPFLTQWKIALPQDDRYHAAACAFVRSCLQLDLLFLKCAKDPYLPPKENIFVLLNELEIPKQNFKQEIIEETKPDETPLETFHRTVLNQVVKNQTKQSSSLLALKNNAKADFFDHCQLIKAYVRLGFTPSSKDMEFAIDYNFPHESIRLLRDLGCLVSQRAQIRALYAENFYSGRHIDLVKIVIDKTTSLSSQLLKEAALAKCLPEIFEYLLSLEISLPLDILSYITAIPAFITSGQTRVNHTLNHRSWGYAFNVMTQLWSKGAFFQEFALQQAQMNWTEYIQPASNPPSHPVLDLLQLMRVVDLLKKPLSLDEQDRKKLTLFFKSQNFEALMEKTQIQELLHSLGFESLLKRHSFIID